MSTATAPAPPSRSRRPATRRSPGRRSAVAVLTFALGATAIAYAVRGEPTVVGAYDEYALSDAQAVSTAPLVADRVVGIPLADAATQATIDRVGAPGAGSSPGQLALLARLLLQRAAVTGDASTYARATSTLDQAVAQAPGDLAVRAQRAAARITVHDFDGAASDAAFVLAAKPDDPGGLAAAYDAAFETGAYDRAEAFLTDLRSMAPEAAPVLFREARWAALHGSSATAAGLASRARTAAIAAGAAGTGRATYDLAAGKIAIDEGRYAAAVGAYSSALEAAPGWHAALAGLGRARAASGDLVGAERALTMAADAVPLPDTLSSLGDVRSALGDTAGAVVAYGTLDVIARLESVQRTFSRAIVLSRADRGVRTAAAVRDARAELSVRRDVYGHDALGWALLADGQPRLAVREADAALSLGTRDPRVLVHAGLIHAAAGHVGRATTLLTTALEQSPTFDPLLADRAREALADLGTGATS